eukprot:TRINITY_DN21489_c0_g1_i1.p1 TRINITY_DN21489_c0_g1~~TRINITY_DN21489_c0_g1_i1.p1  ORF type:complete len:381 (-),score=62.44 TRINITY_DN21489_c0_g1_i1:31-1077(-)
MALVFALTSRRLGLCGSRAAEAASCVAVARAASARRWQPTQAAVGSAYKKGAHLLSGATRGALERIAAAEREREVAAAPLDSLRAAPPPGAVVRRPQNGPAPGAGTTLPAQAYPAHPHNFTPLRPVQPGFDSLDRAVRDTAWESRFELMTRRIEPRFAGECRGTPRVQMQDGLVNGVRVRPVQNPYVKMSPIKKYPNNAWPSRDWKKWRPQLCHVKGSRRRYRLPEDVSPYRDELGEWHPPRVSGRYKADIEKQYYMNSLPWVWATDYFMPKQHFMDREPRGPKRWYKREFRRAQIAAALKRADSLVEDYRKERRDAKRLSWVETVALEFCGDQLAGPFVRQRRLPKL